MKKRPFARMFVRWNVLVLSFLAAIVVYVTADFLVQEKRTVTMPLEVVLPESYTATSIIPASVDLVIKGTEDRIYMVEAQHIGVSADFSSVNKTGVASVPVDIDLSYYENILDKAQVTFYTDPSTVRIYFEEKH